MSVQPRLRMQFDDARQQFDAAKLGMWAFLATEILLFGGLFCVYFFYRAQYAPGFVAASRHTDVALGTVETIVLITSSLTMALAIRAVRMNRTRAVSMLLISTIVLGGIFIAIHAREYVTEFHEHLFPGQEFDAGLASVAGTQLFFLLYYATTSLHGLHVCIGIGTLTILQIQHAHRRFDTAYYTPLELGGLYWHLIDIVWIFVFPLFYLVQRP